MLNVRARKPRSGAPTIPVLPRRRSRPRKRRKTYGRHVVRELGNPPGVVPAKNVSYSLPYIAPELHEAINWCFGRDEAGVSRVIEEIDEAGCVSLQQC